MEDESGGFLHITQQMCEKWDCVHYPLDKGALQVIQSFLLTWMCSAKKPLAVHLNM